MLTLAVYNKHSLVFDKTTQQEYTAKHINHSTVNVNITAYIITSLVEHHFGLEQFYLVQDHSIQNKPLKQVGK